MIQVKIEYERPLGTKEIELNRTVEADKLDVVLGEMIYSIEVQTESFKTADIYETVIATEEYQKINGRRRKVRIPVGEDQFAISFGTKAEAKPAAKKEAKKATKAKK